MTTKTNAAKFELRHRHCPIGRYNSESEAQKGIEIELRLNPAFSRDDYEIVEL